jgi:hypothetical protein
MRRVVILQYVTTHVKLAPILADEYLQEATERLNELEADFMRLIYLHCDIVCESSLLVLILRAIPSERVSDVSPECIIMARNTLDIHEECMKCVSQCRDPLLIRKYVAWYVYP